MYDAVISDGWLKTTGHSSPFRRTSRQMQAVSIAIVAFHELLPALLQISACHGNENSLPQIDAEHVEGLALALGGLGGNHDRGRLLSRQADPIENEIDELS